MRALIPVVASMAALSVGHTPATLLAQKRPPIIDMHLHADLPPHEVPPGAPSLCRPEPCQGTGQATANHAETLEKTLQAMDRYNIVKAFLSGVDPAIVQKWVAAAPDRFIAAPFILQPGRPDPEMLRKSVRRGALQPAWERSPRSSPACRRTIPRSRTVFRTCRRARPARAHSHGGNRAVSARLPHCRRQPGAAGGGAGPPPEAPALCRECGVSLSGEMIAMMYPVSAAPRRRVDHQLGDPARRRSTTTWRRWFGPVWASG